MRFVEALEAIMSEKGVKKAELARRRGVKPQSINTLFSDQKKVSLELAAQTARVIDYRVALVPFDKKLPEGSYELEG